MLERTTLVTNTTPLIALIAATGDLDILCRLYERVVVPFEVCQEMTAGGADQFGVQEFTKDMWLEKRSQSTSIPPILRNSLDFRSVEVAETRDLDENTLLDLDTQGEICAITVEHARERADIPHFSFEHVTAA